MWYRLNMRKDGPHIGKDSISAECSHGRSLLGTLAGQSIMWLCPCVALNRAPKLGNPDSTCIWSEREIARHATNGLVRPPVLASAPKVLAYIYKHRLGFFQTWNQSTVELLCTVVTQVITFQNANKNTVLYCSPVKVKNWVLFVNWLPDVHTALVNNPAIYILSYYNRPCYKDVGLKCLHFKQTSTLYEPKLIASNESKSIPFKHQKLELNNSVQKLQIEPTTGCIDQNAWSVPSFHAIWTIVYDFVS